MLSSVPEAQLNAIEQWLLVFIENARLGLTLIFRISVAIFCVDFGLVNFVMLFRKCFLSFGVLLKNNLGVVKNEVSRSSFN